jgi:hypothetical protein
MQLECENLRIFGMLLTQSLAPSDGERFLRNDDSRFEPQNLEHLLSRPAATLSSIRNGGEGRGKEALGFMERGADRPGEGIFGPLLP